MKIEQTARICDWPHANLRDFSLVNGGFESPTIYSESRFVSSGRGQNKTRLHR